MKQVSAIFSCPRCAEQIQVTAPAMNRQIENVRATETWVPAGECKGWQACPCCRKQYYLSWIFTETNVRGFRDRFHKQL